MSILINGMEMPTNCITCKLRVAVGCCGDLPHNTRMPGCPLVHVPPHGKLIDADKLRIRDAEKQAYEAYLQAKCEDFIEEPLIEYQRGYSDGLTHASGLVKFAPTIIPADRKEEY